MDVAKLATGDDADYLNLWCPGCQDHHVIPTDRHGQPGIVWEWDGSLTAPTVNPSILTTYTVTDRPDLSTACHSFVRDGRWQYLGDCTHSLAGQTVPMIPSQPAPDLEVRPEPATRLAALACPRSTNAGRSSPVKTTAIDPDVRPDLVPGAQRFHNHPIRSHP